MSSRNARFWTYWNGSYVKITLKPGESREVSVGGPTEEGWSSTSECWTHEGQVVTCETIIDGRDCDGRITQYSECECVLEALRSGNTPYIPVGEDGREGDEYREVMQKRADQHKAPLLRFPDWTRVGASQRDYSAEAMGY